MRQAPPRSVFVIAGEEDPIVSYVSMTLSIDQMTRVLACTSKPKVEGMLKTYQGKAGSELLTYIHPGGHVFQREAVPLMVDMFKRHHL
jgi:predicted esterase